MRLSPKAHHSYPMRGDIKPLLPCAPTRPLLILNLDIPVPSSRFITMSSASSVARRFLSQRSIRVLVSPTPVTFAERRSILQVLEQYGPVEVFKMTPVRFIPLATTFKSSIQHTVALIDSRADFCGFTQGYHANFVSVTREAATASKLIACSPLTYDVPESLMNADIHIADLAELEGFDDSTPSAGFATARPTAVEDGGVRRDKMQFKLEIFPEPEYQHRFAMIGSPLQNPWPDVYFKDKSLLSGTLKQSLPQTIAASGFAHWPLDSTEDSCVPRPDRKEERLQLKRWLPSKMKD